mmetsp:Transcript_84505/g.273669  ORF Transcript_84505/g.273669 Transcript_84505/m.273669 type:complete len:202 (-) Transcript_84505:52-657(-)
MGCTTEASHLLVRRLCLLSASDRQRQKARKARLLQRSSCRCSWPWRCSKSGQSSSAGNSNVTCSVEAVSMSCAERASTTAFCSTRNQSWGSSGNDEGMCGDRSPSSGCRSSSGTTASSPGLNSMLVFRTPLRVVNTVSLRKLPPSLPASFFVLPVPHKLPFSPKARNRPPRSRGRSHRSAARPRPTRMPAGTSTAPPQSAW